MNVTVNIGGDFCITASHLEKELLQQSIKDIYTADAINIINLECPVIDNSQAKKIVKHGPHLHTTSKIFDHLQQLNITAVTLANNHILDYGAEGLLNTFNTCRQNNIHYTGAGNNLQDATRHLVIEKNDIKIAVVNFCEHEWSIATKDEPGANPLDIIDNLAQIKKAKQEADKMIVIVHGGSEYYNLPSPGIKKIFRFFADNGADAIISHHTHSISGAEVHNNVPVIFGLGNMLFTKQSNEHCWFTGLTAQLTVKKNEPVTFKLIPTIQSGNYEVRAADGNEKEKILNNVDSLSAVIANDELLQKEWEALVNKRAAQYLYTFSAVPALPGKYISGAARRMGLVNSFLPGRFLTGVINYISCEAHRDIAIQALKNKLNKK